MRSPFSCELFRMGVNLPSFCLSLSEECWFEARRARNAKVCDSGGASWVDKLQQGWSVIRNLGCFMLVFGTLGSSPSRVFPEKHSLWFLADLHQKCPFLSIIYDVSLAVLSLKYFLGCAAEFSGQADPPLTHSMCCNSNCSSYKWFQDRPVPAYQGLRIKWENFNFTFPSPFFQECGLQRVQIHPWGQGTAPIRDHDHVLH